MRIPLNFLQNATTLLILFMTTGAFQSLLVESSDAQVSTEGSPAIWLVWGTLYAIVALRLYPRRYEVAALVRANKFLFALIFLSLLSTAWSQDPAFTIRRSIALFATALFGIDFALRYSLRQQLRLLGLALGAFVVLSVFVQVLLPGLVPSLDFGDEAWHGVLSYKNEFARVVVLAAIALVCLLGRTLKDFFLAFFVVAIAFGLTLAANSKGAFIVLAATLLMFWTPTVVRWTPRLRTFILVASSLVAIPIAYALFENIDAVFAILGRDATLTGRSSLWRLALGSIAKRPLLGYGYVAFWSSASQEATRIRQVLNWEAPHSHNGYIEILLATGVVGLFLYLSTYFVSISRALQSLKFNFEPEAMWPMAFLSFSVFTQLTEGSIVAANSIFWILYVASACNVTQAVYPELVRSRADRFSSPVPTDADVVADYA